MKLTKIGYYYLLLAFVVFFAGIRRELNLLWLIAGMMCGPLVFNALIPWRIIRTITLKRQFPESCFPNERITYTLELNTRSFFRFCGLILNGNPDSKTFRLEKIQELRPEKHCTRRILRYTAKFARRGEYDLPPVVVKCDYPFGFCESRRTFHPNDKILVLPKLAELPSELYEAVGNLDDASHSRGFLKSMTGDFAGLRLWCSGDLFRQIHWRASARNQQLLVQKFELPQKSRFFILANFTDNDEERFERTVSLTAAIIHEVDQEIRRAALNSANHCSIFLKILGKQIVTVTNEQDDFYYRAMRELAIVEMRDGTSSPVNLQTELYELREMDPHGNFLYISNDSAQEIA